MKFRTKIFLSLLTVSTILSVGILLCSYFVVKEKTEKEFFSRYDSLGNVISNTFQQVGEISDQANKNAVDTLRIIEKYSGIPSDKKLANLADELGVQGFYVINSNGKFLRSSDIPIVIQKNSLFSYCAGYKNLISGGSRKAVTPIIPGYPGNIPVKLIMIPNADRSLILESGIRLSYISEILHKAVEYNKNINTIGLFSPNGYMLGFITADGKFTQGKQKFPINELSGTHIKNKSMILNFIIPANIGYCCECKIKHVENINQSDYHYILQINVSLAPLIKTLSDIRDYFFILFFIALLINLLISKLLSRKLVRRIQKMNDVVSGIIKTNNLKCHVKIDDSHDEIAELGSNFNKMISNLDEYQLKEIEYEKTKEIQKISQQVAHDIRSPLTALEMIITRLPEIEESKYILLRDSINHIRDITNNLDKKNVLPESAEFQDASIQIAVLLDYVISERRAAFSNPSICILHDFSAEAYGFFVQADRSEMKRILTNLINNSYEAVLNHGNKITIALHKNNENVEIIISDNGSGISDEISASLFARGFTTKKSGSGLGLFHAKETLSQWGGKIELHNNISQGAFATITLPLQKSPDWFLDELFFQKNSTVICVDDSISIFHAWQERFKGLSGNIDLQYAKSKEALLSQIERNKNNICTYLIDYEFSGKSYNGLDLINIILSSKSEASRIFLVTSRSDEIHIQEFCAENNIQMIPKFFAFKIVLRMDEQ